MKCPKCTGENSYSQHFCGTCGTPLPGSFHTGGSDQDLSETKLMPQTELRTGLVFADRYQVIEELGSGGMGRVYRVLDKKVDEEIALKLLKPDATRDGKFTERFRAELKTARKVVHRNVARVFDLNEAEGVLYITMEYVRGENLRRLIRKVGRLDAAQVVPIASQVCRGLAEAHRLGIVHRDLKPQNIMIDEDGGAQILDFGLARLASYAGDADSAHIEGTPAYIAPEQIEKRAVDRRADLYSLGIVLYEMVTGHPPFKADSASALTLKHINELPRNPREIRPDLPPGLIRVIMTCLEKRPEKRYQSADQVLADLVLVEQEISSGKIPAPPSVRPEKTAKSPPRRFRASVPRAAAVMAALTAVLFLAYMTVPIKPFMPSIAVLLDESGETDASLDSLSHGLQRNTIQKLSSIPRLRVIPWETVSEYGDETKSHKEIGADLGAKYLLRMNLRSDAGNYRLTANLIEAARGDIIQPFIVERPEEDYFLVEDDLPRLIARALKVHLVEERLRKIKLREPKNLEAYNHFLDGMAVYHREFEKGVEHFEKAVEIDSRYALAYWGLGNAYEARYNSSSGHGGKSEDLERMFQAYRQAYDYNPNSPETNLGLGWAYFNEQDNAKAFEYFRRALKLDPGSVTVNLDAGAFLRSLGLYDRAVKHFARADRLNRLDPEPILQMAQCRAYMGRYESALKLTKKALVLKPGDLQVLNAHATYLAITGRIEEAEKAIESFITIDPQDRKPSIPSAFLAATRGEKEKALELMSGTGKEDVPESLAAKRWLAPEGTCLYLRLGMEDEAVRNIEIGIERGFAERRMYLYSYPSLARNPHFKVLRTNSRFQAVLNKQKDFYLKELKKIEKL